MKNRGRPFACSRAMADDPEYEIQPFCCLQCGNCCRGEGIVRIRAEEIGRIAGFLGLTVDGFRGCHTRAPGDPEQAAAGDLWALDKPGPDRECIFLEDNRCVIHPVKPVQCIGFPLKWRTPDVMDYCEGMRR